MTPKSTGDARPEPRPRAARKRTPAEAAVDPRPAGFAPRPRPRRRRPAPTWLLPVAAGVALAAAGAAVYWFAYAGPIRSGLDSARAYYGRGEYARAEAALDAVFARDANQVEGLLELARVNAATGDSAAALTLYERVVERWPNDAAVHYELAALERLLGNTAAAVPHLEVALRLEPDEPRYLDQLVKAYIATGRSRDAADMLLERAEDTSRTDAERAALYVQAAAALIEARADDEAKTTLAKALKLAPGDPAAARMLGQLK